MKSTNPVALITGANRGIGFEAARQLAKLGVTVVLGSRDYDEGKKAADILKKEGLDAVPIRLNVTRDAQIRRALQWVSKTYGRLDILINNAGVFIDDVRTRRGYERGSAFFSDLSVIRESFEINTLGAFRMCQVFLPLMMKQKYGRIVNLSSGMGQLTHMNGGRPGYRLSKTALNGVTRIFSEETKGCGILVNSVCPGWVRTRMGGKKADLSPGQGARTVVWLATLPKKGPTGGFFRERKRIPW